MFEVIRVASDYSIVVVVTPLAGQPGDVANKYFLYNRGLFDDLSTKELDLAEEKELANVDAKKLFCPVSERDALCFFSGIADGIGFGELPEKSFESLVGVWRWVREKQAMADEKQTIDSLRYILRGPKRDLLDVLFRLFSEEEIAELLEKGQFSPEEKATILRRWES